MWAEIYFQPYRFNTCTAEFPDTLNAFKACKQGKLRIILLLDQSQKKLSRKPSISKNYIRP